MVSSRSSVLIGIRRFLARSACRVAVSSRYAAIADSPYRPGRRRAWINPPVRRLIEAWIVGFYGGPRRGVAVIVAANDADGQLKVIGQVGAGLAGTERTAWYNVLSA